MALVPVSSQGATAGEDALTTKGDLLTQDPTGTYARIPVGTANQVYAVSSGLPAPVTIGGDVSGNPTALAIGNAKVTLPKMIGTFPYLLVQTGAPTTLTSPLVYDNTAVTGGLYAWSGVAYVKIAGLVA